MPAILRGASTAGKRDPRIPRAGAFLSPLVFSLALLLAALPAGCPAGKPEARRPSILLITIDAVRPEAAKMPALDALAARSVRFTDASTTAPMTLPAAASLMTGRYPHETGVRLESGPALADSAKTLAEHLAGAGYRTGGIGATPWLHPRYGIGQGFEKYFDSFGEIPRPREAMSALFPSKRVVDRSLEWLEGAHREPYFFWANLEDLQAAGGAEAPYERLLEGLDRELGRLVARIGEYGEEERTIVVVAGLTGAPMGDHGEEIAGTLLYQGSVKIPLIVKPAGAAITGRDVAVPVSLVDVLPTLLEAAGVTVPSDLSGRSLAPALPAGGDPPSDREILLESSLPAALFGWSPVAAARSGRFKYVTWGGGRLFDLTADPGETRDVSAEHPAEAERLRRAAASIPPWTPPACDECAAEARRLGLPWPGEGHPAAPVDPESRIEAGSLALKAQRTLRRRSFESAELLYKEALGKDPDNLLALRDLGVMTGLRQQLPEAKALLAKAQRLYGTDSEVYHALGHMALVDEKGLGGKATDLFRISGRLDPLNEEALYDAACGVATSGKNNEEALDLLERSIAAGFRDFPHMRKDKDLDGLRADARFQKLIPPLPAGSAPPPATPPPAPGTAAAPQ